MPFWKYSFSLEIKLICNNNGIPRDLTISFYWNLKPEIIYTYSIFYWKNILRKDIILFTTLILQSHLHKKECIIKIVILWATSWHEASYYTAAVICATPFFHHQSIYRKLGHRYAINIHCPLTCFCVYMQQYINSNNNTNVPSRQRT